MIFAFLRFCCVSKQNPLVIFPEDKQLRHMVDSLIFCGFSILFSIMVVVTWSPINSVNQYFLLTGFFSRFKKKCWIIVIQLELWLLFVLHHGLRFCTFSKCISSLTVFCLFEKYLFVSDIHFLTEMLVLLQKSLTSWMLWILILYQMLSLKFFSFCIVSLFNQVFHYWADNR